MSHQPSKPFQNTGAIQLAASCAIFGTIGLFRRWIGLSSGMIAFGRGIIGALFMLCVILIGKSSPDWKSIRKNALPLLASGAAIGCNWVLLFQAYRYTTVATATLCYYMAPVFVLILSPILLHERLNRRQAMCVPAALLGAVLVSGIVESGLPQAGEATGILCGLGAAVLYASVMLINRRLTGIRPHDRTVVQLLMAGMAVLPYALLAEGLPTAVSLTDIGLLLIVGCVHTGLAYSMWFGALTKVPAHTAALLSYIDPVVAILLSALLLSEPLTISGGIGAALILLSAIISEL